MAVELQLGLGLALIPTKAFDLNAHIHDTATSLEYLAPACAKKRALDFDPCSAFRRTLPLLLWNHHPNDGDDDPKDLDRSSASRPNQRRGGGNGLVGWPPLKKRRKRLFMEKRGRRRGPAAENRRPVEDGGGFHRGWNSSCTSNSRYVKVKMEGVGIARKVDLSLHDSFAALTATLMDMFDETDSADAYRLTYQDIDGDWLLAQEVTWRNFVGTVKRIQLEKK